MKPTRALTTDQGQVPQAERKYTLQTYGEGDITRFKHIGLLQQLTGKLMMRTRTQRAFYHFWGVALRYSLHCYRCLLNRTKKCDCIARLAIMRFRILVGSSYKRFIFLGWLAKTEPFKKQGFNLPAKRVQQVRSTTALSSSFLPDAIGYAPFPAVFYGAFCSFPTGASTVWAQKGWSSPSAKSWGSVGDPPKKLANHPKAGILCKNLLKIKLFSP